MFGKKRESRVWSVGDRFIHLTKFGGRYEIRFLVEYKVVEVSPSGEWILVTDVNGEYKDEWCLSSIKVDELLGKSRPDTIVTCQKNKVIVSVGQELLITGGSGTHKCKILEISPSGKLIKYSGKKHNQWWMAVFLHVRDIYPIGESEPVSNGPICRICQEHINGDPEDQTLIVIDTSGSMGILGDSVRLRELGDTHGGTIIPPDLGKGYKQTILVTDEVYCDLPKYVKPWYVSNLGRRK